MQPFSVKLLYNGKPWVTVDLEVGHNEIGDADEPDFVSPEDANAVLENLGFPPLGPIPVMALRHQIAQKLHAVSAPSSMRAHGCSLTARCKHGLPLLREVRNGKPLTPTSCQAAT